MCSIKNNDKSKMNLPLPPSTVFLIAEKLPSLLRNFQTFSLFCEKVNVIAWIIFY